MTLLQALWMQEVIMESCSYIEVTPLGFMHLKTAD